MVAKKNLLLINPPPRADVGAQLHLEHLGLGYLAASVRRHLGRSHTAAIWDCCIVDKTMRHVQQVVARLKPAYVGLTLTAMNAKEGIAVARTIKRIDPGIKIILGGILTSALKTSDLAVYQPDAIVRGEGEEAITEVLTRLDNDPSGGLVEITRDTAIDVDTIAWPARDMLPWQLRQHPQTSMAASRGCPYRCSFCSIPPAGRIRKWRPRNIEDVVEEMRFIHKQYKSVHFYFVDDNFLLPTGAALERAEQFARLVLDKLPPVRFGFMCRSAAVDKRLFRLLQQAGLSGVFLGIESFSQPVLDRYNKKETVEEHLRAISILNRLGITINPGFIFFDPWTNVSEIHETINVMQRIDFPSLQAINSKLTCYIGTDVEKHIPDMEDPTPSIGIKHYRFEQSATNSLFETCCAIFYKKLIKHTDYVTYQNLSYAMGYLQPYCLNTAMEPLFTIYYAQCKAFWQRGDLAILQWIKEQTTVTPEKNPDIDTLVETSVKAHWRHGNALARQFLVVAEAHFLHCLATCPVDQARLAALAFTLPSNSMRLDKVLEMFQAIAPENHVVIAEMLAFSPGSHTADYVNALVAHTNPEVVQATVKSAILQGMLAAIPQNTLADVKDAPYGIIGRMERVAKVLLEGTG